MSVIQQIRDKAAWLVFGLIALALAGFLLMDAFVGRSRFFGGSSTTVGEVNGEQLEYAKFQKQTTDREDQYKAKGYPVNEMIQQNIKEEVWKQFIEESVMSGVYNQIGIEVSDKELNDMLVGPNAIPEIRQSFTDPKTGIFDGQAAASTIGQLRTIWKGNKKTDKGYEEAKRFFEEGIPQIVKAREREKYLSLIANSSYVPRWMVEKTISDNSQIASIKFVNTPYSNIADSTVRISDDEIKEYVNKHKDQYKQEETRSVAYVLFNAGPTAGDSAKVRDQMMNLRNEFAATTDAEGFIARNGSEIPYSDRYTPLSKLQSPHKDSIIAIPKSGIFGPYLDINNYVIAKKIDEKPMPDSVRVRHILIATVDPKTGQAIMEDSIARKKIDSIKMLFEKGESFDSLAAKFSDDPSKVKGGDLGYFAAGTMVKEFNDFSFNGKKGEKKVVKTQFGYHFIDILDQKGFQPAFKVAYLAKKIEPSQETDQNASGLANQFAGESRNQKAFEENVRKNNLKKLQAPDIQPTDNSIQGLGLNRQLVRWIYEASTGDVSEPFNVGDKYVVAMLTEINHEGIMTVGKARPLVEPILRNEKKADKINQKIGATPSSLEAVANISGQKVQSVDSISFNSPYIPNLGQESKVVGTAFNKQLLGKPCSPPIAGSGGVFVIKVQTVVAKPTFNADIEQMRKSQQQMQQSIAQRQAIEVLKKTASIKDNRSKFL